MSNIVKSNSEAYGYNYASLSDIAKQGYTIPKMKTITENDKDYVCYFDEKLNEWVRGAEVVMPDTKGSNKAQNYGSALTYARRYTCHLALQLACDDDKEIETKRASDRQVDYIRKIYDVVNVAKILKHYEIEKLEDLTQQQASEVIENKKNGKINNQ